MKRPDLSSRAIQDNVGENYLKVKKKMEEAGLSVSCAEERGNTTTANSRGSDVEIRYDRYNGEIIRIRNEKFLNAERRTMHLSELEQVRKARLDKIRELNVDPYGCAIQGVEKIASLVDNFRIGEPLAPNPESLFYSTPRRAQGRIVLRRDNGGLIWFKIRDDSGEIQVAFSKKSASESENFALAKLTDLGDIIAVDGPIRRTQTGEITIWASRIYLA